MAKQVLIVGADSTITVEVARVAGAMGLDTIQTASAADAIALLGGSQFSIAIVDLGLPAGEGVGVIMKARTCRPAVTALALTAHGSVAGAVDALRAGAADVVAKPFHTSALEDALERMLESPERTGQRGRRTPGVAVIGDHPAMRLVLERVDQIADTDACVLIRGETGTGKEVIARLVHGASGRRTRPFVAVNLAALPESLAEAELFGHLPGAFTGATRARTGRLAAAHGGTLFLDEIGEMPRCLQAKLLRVLQEREFEPLGSERTQKVDLRVIAATNRDLRQMVADGRFQEDLYYRLNVIPIHIPPLRERREDIPALVEHFIAKHAQRAGKRIDSVAPGVLEMLRVADWPGNVRELENTVERAVVLTPGPAVSLDSVRILAPASSAPAGLPSLNLRQNIDWVERETVRRALDAAAGVKKDAAETMGISQRALSYYLAKHRVD